MKEVKIIPRKEVKKKLLLDILSAIRAGNNPTHISKELSISKQKLNYYLRELKDKGFIKKIGYGVWEVKSSHKDTRSLEVKEVRGHAFIWKIKLPKIKNWDKRKEILEKMKIPYKTIRMGTPRILFKNRKIWLGSKNLVIYETKSFIAKSSLQSRKMAVWGLIELLEALESKLKVSFKTPEGYQFSVSREHYALMKNQLAIQCNKTGERINVRDKDGVWFIVDNSYNLDEAETIGKNAIIIIFKSIIFIWDNLYYISTPIFIENYIPKYKLIVSA